MMPKTNLSAVSGVSDVLATRSRGTGPKPSCSASIGFTALINVVCTSKLLARHANSVSPPVKRKSAFSRISTLRGLEFGESAPAVISARSAAVRNSTREPSAAKNALSMRRKSLAKSEVTNDSEPSGRRARENPHSKFTMSRNKRAPSG